MTRGLVVALALMVACGSGAGASPPLQGSDEGADSAGEGADGASDGAGGEAGDDATTGDDAASGADATIDDASDAGEGPIYLETGATDRTGVPQPCVGPLQDAGFTSLSDLPLASMCATYGGVWEGLPPCQGSILVSASPYVGGAPYWLFDATTGALEAAGFADDGNFGCSGGLPTFPFPYQCFYFGGWPQQTDLCADGGPQDSGVADGPGAGD